MYTDCSKIDIHSPTAPRPTSTTVGRRNGRLIRTRTRIHDMCMYYALGCSQQGLPFAVPGFASLGGPNRGALWLEGWTTPTCLMRSSCNIPIRRDQTPDRSYVAQRSALSEGKNMQCCRDISRLTIYGTFYTKMGLLDFYFVT